MDEVPAWSPPWRRERTDRQGERGRDQRPNTYDGDQGEARLRHGIGSQLKFRTGTEYRSRPLNSNGGWGVNKETKGERRINSPSVDLKPVMWVMVCLLKQLGDLTMDEMKRRTRHWGDRISQSKPSTVVWQTTPSTYTWWTKYVWILIILMIGVLSGVRSSPGPGGVCSAPGPEFGVHHRFTAYDCEHPTSVQALKLPRYCLTQKTKDDTTNQTTDLITIDNNLYQLLQRVTYYEFEAHQCIQTRSRFLYSCVWASHSVMNVVPETGRHVVTTLDFCTQAIKTHMYITEAGTSVPLNADGQTTYIKIRKNFDTGELMIMETGTTIPKHLTTPGGFSIDAGTYITPKVNIPCAYQVIKSFRGTANPTTTKEDLVITSQVDQVHIHTHGLLNPPSRCPIQGTYWKTGHPNIVVFQKLKVPVAHDDVGFNPIDAQQVSIPNMVMLKVEWALYKT